MRTTLNLDDELIADAATYSGITDKGKLVHMALDFYVKRTAARRLVALGGTMPDLVIPPRNSSRSEVSYSEALKHHNREVQHSSLQVAEGNSGSSSMAFTDGEP